MTNPYFTDAARADRAEARVAVLDSEVFAIGVRRCAKCHRVVHTTLNLSCEVCKGPMWPMTERSLRLQLAAELDEIRSRPAPMPKGPRWRIAVARAYRRGVEDGARRLPREQIEQREREIVEALNGKPKPNDGGDAA